MVAGKFNYTALSVPVHQSRVTGEYGVASGGRMKSAVVVVVRRTSRDRRAFDKTHKQLLWHYYYSW